MGKLYLIGMGPGASDLIAPRALAAITASTDLVSYGFYLDVLGDICQGKQQHEFALGQEPERAKHALNLAAVGKTVALVSSGDIGIYAMAAMVFELLDPQTHQDQTLPAAWQGIEIEVIPGISAMQAGAASTGALLGHDFCTISLSDLLTPWDTIVQRVHAAGQGDFVVCFYNPVSKKRHWQLNHARDLLLQYRPSTTPVLIGRQLTRPEESISLITLSQLEASDVDMFTLVVVGNSESRHFLSGSKAWLYTPRGYGNKNR